MRVTDAIARALTSLGADTVFGVAGSGNFHLTNALIAPAPSGSGSTNCAPGSIARR